MKNILPVVILLLSLNLLPGQISFKNHLEFTHWSADKRDITENWTDLTYQRRWLAVGARYEINSPPDPFIFPRDSLLDRYELTYRYAQIRYKRWTAIIGNYYAIFGRGLTLRTYEDRNLRVDNNIDGLKLNYGGRRFKGQVMAGKMRDKYNRRKNMLYGLDAEYLMLPGLRTGASFLKQSRNGTDRHSLLSGRINWTRNWWDVYGEIIKGEWTADPSYYIALNLAFSRLALALELKDYNQLSFIDFYSTEYNAGPSLSREHAFALLNRHPHALNMNDETGYQIELSYFPLDQLQVTLNHSQTFTHADQRIFQEYYMELLHNPFETLEYRLIAAWNFDFTTNTENITPILDLSYDFSARDQLHFSFQHQHTKNRFDRSEYDDELVILEYSRAPFMSIGLVGEYTNKFKIRNVTMDRHQWLYGIVSFNVLNNQRLSLLYGARQAGFVCVGGICRYEPEFEGLELKITTRL